MRAPASLDSTSRLFTFGLLACALVVFVGQALVRPKLPLAGDPEWYHCSAIGILRGEGYVVSLPPHEHPQVGPMMAYYPVGWPAFLAAVYRVTGPRPMAALLTNALLLSLDVLLTFAVGRCLLGERLARVGAVCFLLLASLTRMSCDGYSETFLIFLLLGALWLALSRPSLGWQVVAGVVLGMTHLVRPVSLFVPLMFFIALVLLRRRWKRSLVRALTLLIVSLAVVAPWTYRNWMVFHRFVLVSTNGGLNLWMGNNPNASGGYVRQQWGEMLLPPGHEQATDEVAWDANARREAKRFILSHPGTVLRRLPAKLSYLCGYGYLRRARSRGDNWLRMASVAALSSVVATCLLCSLTLAAWATARIVRERSLACGYALVPPLMVGYFLAFPLVFFGVRRFIYPAYPFFGYTLAVLGAWVAERLATRTRPSTTHQCDPR